MRKFLLPLLLVALCTACIDKDYDLSKINTDDITIGDEQRFPLATVKISLNELQQDSRNIEDICNDAKVWLPKPMPGNAGFFDIERSKTDNTYINSVIDALIAQMKSDPKKREEVATIACRDYKNVFISAMGVPVNISDAEFVAKFTALFPTQTAIQAQARTTAAGFLKDLTIKDLNYTIGNIEISSDVVKMLTGNLDKGGKLHLYGTIQSKLPVSLRIRPAFLETNVAFSVDVDATKTENPITEQPLTKEDMDRIVEGIQVLIPADLLKYYPDKPFDNTTTEQIVLKLHLVKRGGLSLNL